MSSTDGRAHDDLTLARDLILFVTTLASIQELYGLLGTLIRVDLHAFVTTYTTYHSWLLTASVIA